MTRSSHLAFALQVCTIQRVLRMAVINADSIPEFQDFTQKRGFRVAMCIYLNLYLFTSQLGQLQNCHASLKKESW
jgi:hypothetical protein